MDRTTPRILLAFAATLFIVASPVRAQNSPPPLTRQTLPVPGSNLFLTHAPGDFSRLFVVAQNGVIRIVRLPQFTLDATPFLTVPNVVSGGESGLLCLAFHPDYANNGYLYVCVNHNMPGGTPSIIRFTRRPDNPDAADPATALNILTLGGGNTNHNGGWIGFGPDRLLYISSGDHGSSSSARDLTDNLRGKILRIDVDGDDFPADAARNYRIPPGNPFVGIEGDDEIYAFGFRNPWRCAIDPATGNMYIGDVGTSREELNVLPIAQAGLDFGWPCQEGANNGCPPGTSVVLPIAHYRFGAEAPLFISGNAVIGGEVYRGCAIPPLRGRYFFGDLSGDFVSLRYDGAVSDVINHTSAFQSGAYGFGHDAYGELYFGHPAEISRIVSTVAIGRDCNGNGIPDACDLVAGSLTDANADGVPDECPPLGDFDGDGDVGLPDLAVMLTAFGSCAGGASYNNEADFNSDGCNDIHDLTLLLSRFGS